MTVRELIEYLSKCPDQHWNVSIDGKTPLVAIDCLGHLTEYPITAENLIISSMVPTDTPEECESVAIELQAAVDELSKPRTLQ